MQEGTFGLELRGMRKFQPIGDPSLCRSQAATWAKRPSECDLSLWFEGHSFLYDGGRAE